MGKWNIQLIDLIVPKNDGAFPTHDAQYGLGGWRNVPDTATRDAITPGRRISGMACRVNSNGKTYILQDDLVTWVEEPSGGGGGMTNPMTDIGDMITGDVAGDPERVAIGTPSQILFVGKNLKPAWVDFNNLLPISHPGDLLVGDSTGAPVALGSGTPGQVLTTTSDGTVDWETASGGALDLYVPPPVPVAPVYADWVQPSNATYATEVYGQTPKGVDNFAGSFVVFNNQLWREGAQGTIEIMDITNGNIVQTLDLARLLNSTSPPIVTQADPNDLYIQSLWAVDTTRNHLWLRSSATNISDVGTPWLTVINLANKTVLFTIRIQVGESNKFGILKYDPVSDLIWYQENSILQGRDPSSGTVVRTITAESDDCAIVIDTDKGELWAFTTTSGVAAINVYSTVTGATTQTLTSPNVPAFTQAFALTPTYCTQIKEIVLGDYAWYSFSTISYTMVYANTTAVAPGGKSYYKADTDEFVSQDNTLAGSIVFVDRATRANVRYIFGQDSNDLYLATGNTMYFGPDGALYADVIYDWVFNGLGTRRYCLKISHASLLADSVIANFQPPIPASPDEIIPPPSDWSKPIYQADEVMYFDGAVLCSNINARRGLVETRRSSDGGFLEFWGIGALAGYVGSDAQQRETNWGRTFVARQAGIDTLRNHFWTECAAESGTLVGVFDLGNGTLIQQFQTYTPPLTPFSRDQYLNATYDAVQDKVWFNMHDFTRNQWTLKSFNANTYAMIDDFDVIGATSALDTDQSETWVALENNGTPNTINVHDTAGALLHTLSLAGSLYNINYLPGSGVMAIYSYDANQYDGNGAETIQFWSTSSYTLMGTWVAASPNQYVLISAIEYLPLTQEIVVGLENDDTDSSSNLITISINTYQTIRTLLVGNIKHEVPNFSVYGGGDLYVSTYVENNTYPDNAVGARMYLRKISAASLASI